MATRMRVGVLSVLLLGAGCFYSPSYKPDLECSVDGTCPSGLTCQSDGFCRKDGPATDDGGRPIDGAVLRDGGACLDLNGSRNVDILFVVDNSGSMAQEQGMLIANFQRLFTGLASAPGGLPNLHIGVVSSDMGVGSFSIASCMRSGGDRGVLQNTAQGACTPPTGRYISDVLSGGTRQTNYTGTLSEALGCIARLGTAGCGFEQHLESMQRALDGTNSENAGFLREDALLAVFILADEDDCSAVSPGTLYDPSQTTVSTELGPLTSFRCFDFGVTCSPQLNRTMPGPRQNCVSNESSRHLKPVGGYIDSLIAIKGSRNLVLVNGLVGNASPVEVGTDAMSRPVLLPSCSGVNGDAAPAVRLTQFIDNFAGAPESICQTSYDEALQRFGTAITTAMQRTCP